MTVEPSASAPTYAPTGQALVLRTAPGRADGDAAAWSERALFTLHEWFPGLPAGAARVLRVDLIPFGLMAQPPGVHARLQTLTRLREGLYLAGEQALASSLNAVLLSGERAAKAVVTDRRPGAASP